MAVFKCKMCGGTLEIKNNETVAVCEYCGTKQTLPKLDDDRKANLYDRANHFRRNNEFDKAMGIYEQILNEDSTDAESYWSLVLCQYGIEYVEDPATHKRIPTVNRAQYTSIFDDEDYKSALQYADGSQKEVYEAEADAINEIQKGILAISGKEEPFDIFICYKETDQNGRRTPDSVLATELYHELTREGFKVFFSRITLEDKLGQEYEPYIFAALNSAKVMVVLGTKPEYFNAVWVKNEWNRYLALIKNGSRKMLIPAYKDMDPYDLPEEFSHLQAQDMSKLGFMQDLIRGIKKLTQAEEGKKPVKETVVVNTNTNIAPLLKRAFMFIEDGDWNSANEYCEKVLDIDPECAEAYLGKLLAELKVRKQEDLADCEQPFDESNNYKKAIRFADEKLSKTLKGYISHINERNENARLEGIYAQAVKTMNGSTTQTDFEQAAQTFESIESYKDSSSLAKECREQADICRKNDIYNTAKMLMNGTNESAFNAAIEKFEEIPGWKDSDELIMSCRSKIEEIKAKQESDRLEGERKAEEKRIAKEKAAKKRKKILVVSTPIVCVIIAFVIVLTTVIIPLIHYNEGLELLESGDYIKAIQAFSAARSYKDAPDKRAVCYKAFKNNEIISAESNNTVGLKADGTVVAVGSDYEGKCDVSNWKDIVEISAGYNHTVGLKTDGTVIAVGDNVNCQCDVSNWNDIVTISAGSYHTVGLKADGTVIAVGNNGSGQCDVSNWNDIVTISAGNNHTIGLKADGTVIAVGNNDYGQCDVSKLNDIVSISSGYYHTVGLKADGTVIAVGNNDYGQCDVSKLNDIVSISSGYYHTVGLKRDGTVVAVGFNSYGRCDVSNWNNIIAISAGLFHTVGLKSDGTVVAVGNNGSGQCNVSEWKDIMIPQ